LKKSVAAVMLASFALAACAGPSRGAGELTVFAAASLTDAFREMGTTFEAANPGMSVTFNFAGSQTLRTQIEQGAPADVFASANEDQMAALVADGMVRQDEPRVFLRNELVLVLPPNNPAQLTDLRDLGRADLKVVMAAADVPVGAYSRQALDKMDAAFGAAFKSSVLQNVVSNEDNVKQVVTKIQLGEADAGIVYTSDAIAAPDLQTIEIPAPLNVVARYPIAVLAHSARPQLGEQFIRFVLSAQGQAILNKWGFQPAG
jgi:molybdate transport system substrate-binding protein